MTVTMMNVMMSIMSTALTFISDELDLRPMIYHHPLVLSHLPSTEEAKGIEGRLRLESIDGAGIGNGGIEKRINKGINGTAMAEKAMRMKSEIGIGTTCTKGDASPLIADLVKPKSRGR